MATDGYYKQVFGKRRWVKGKKPHGKKVGKAKRGGGKRKGRRGPVVHVGNAVFRVRKLANCTPTGGPEHALRCDVDVFKTPVRHIKMFPMHPQRQLPGIMGLRHGRGR